VRYNLAYPFYESALARPERLALSVGETQFTYSALREQVQPIAHWPGTHSPLNAPRVGILASRTPGTDFGILGTCGAGGSYMVPSTVRHFETIPLNASGKVHRQDWAELVAQGKLNAAN
jgi:non-ribosomal peptide synthetase component F